MPDLKKRHIYGPAALKWIRRIAATVCFIAITMFFTSGSASLMLKMKWIASIQFIPVALSVSIGLIVFWVLATVLFGRIYCSTVCPMGYIQDIAARIPRMTRRQRLRRPYRHSPGRQSLRLSWLALTVVTAVAGTSIVISLFDPYSAFGRIASSIVSPITAVAGGHAVATGTLAGIVAAVTLIAIVAAATRSGRTYCNTLCPVGSTLGLLSANSVFGFDIDTDRCVQCRRCEHVCKSRCISTVDHVVDMSRCVVCFDCVAECDSRAIRYTFRRHRLATPLMMRIGLRRSSPTLTTARPDGGNASLGKTDSDACRRPVDRRRFLATSMMAAAIPVVSAIDDTRRRFEPLTPSRNRSAHRPVPPPGITSTRRFLNACVGCGACIDACPGKVLRASTDEYGWHHTLHPLMNYDESYCRYNCTVCTRICPTSALSPLTVSEKHVTAIGLATVDPDRCIGCGKCAARCPRQTITMQTGPSGRRVAVVDRSGCIGCGACQYICPATPDRAIVVNGLQR